MKIFLDTGIFSAYLVQEIREKIEGGFEGIRKGEDTLFTSPLILEEFFHTLLYNSGKDSKIFWDLIGHKEDRQDKLNYFFSTYGNVLQTLLAYTQPLGVPKEIRSLLANKMILEKLNDSVRTMDILHLLTSGFNDMDAIFTSDKKLYDWIRENHKLFEGTLKDGFLIAYIDIEEVTIDKYILKY